MLSVRDAAVADAGRIAEIHVRAWQRAYRGLLPDDLLDGLTVSPRESFWTEILSKHSRNVLVSELSDDATADDAVLTGWITFGPNRDEDAPSTTAELYGLYVDPDRWRTGSGTALWGAMLARFAPPEYDSVTLWVFRDNARACAFYESMGFVRDLGVEKTVERGGARPIEVRYRRPF